MTLEDRLRVRLDAGPTSLSRDWGDGTYGEGDYGWSVPEWEAFACIVQAADYVVGRDRLTDLAQAGTLTLRARGQRPTLVAAPGEQAAGLSGRPILVEVQDSGTWSPWFVGTVETANARIVARGLEGESYVEWTITALDSLSRMSTAQAPAGTADRASEGIAARLAALAELAGLEYSDAAGSAASLTCPASTLDRDLKTEAELPAEAQLRLVSLRDRAGIEAVPWASERTAWPTAAGGRVRWLVSSTPDLSDVEAGFDYAAGVAISAAPRWGLLPQASEANVSWPLGRMMNDVTIGYPALPGAWRARDTASIAAYGSRTFARDVEVAAGSAAIALDYAQDIRNEFGQPWPRLVSLVIPFHRLMDTDTALGAPGAAPTDVVGFPFTLAALSVHDHLEARLPPDDDGVTWAASGPIIGYRWAIDDRSATLTITTDARVYAIEEEGPELALEFASGATLEVSLPSTWAALYSNASGPVDVEVYLDCQLRSIAADQSILDTSTGTADGCSLSYQVALGRFQQVLQPPLTIPVNYNTGIDLARFQALWWIDTAFAASAAQELVHPSLGSGTVASSPPASGLAYNAVPATVPGFGTPNRPRLGGTGFTGRIFRFQLRQRTTGDVLVDVNPADFAAGGWTDPYGNTITVSGTVTVVTV